MRRTPFLPDSIKQDKSNKGYPCTNPTARISPVWGSNSRISRPAVRTVSPAAPTVLAIFSGLRAPDPAPLGEGEESIPYLPRNWTRFPQTQIARR